MTALVVLTVLEIVVLIAALAFYLFWVGTLLARIAGNLEECGQIVRDIVADAALIGPGVGHINETGGVVAGALPLLYGMAEGIVTGVTPRPEPPAAPEPARPASGTRRSRLHDAVGYSPHLSRTSGADSHPPQHQQPELTRDRPSSLAEPLEEGPELGNNLWLGVQGLLQLVHLVWRQPKDPVLGEHSASTFHRGSPAPLSPPLTAGNALSKIADRNAPYAVSTDPLSCRTVPSAVDAGRGRDA